MSISYRTHFEDKPVNLTKEKGFDNYASSIKALVISQNPDSNSSQIEKIIKAEWKALTAEEQEKFMPKTMPKINKNRGLLLDKRIEIEQPIVIDPQKIKKELKA